MPTSKSMSDWWLDNGYELLSFITGRRGRRSFDQENVGKANTDACAQWSNGNLRKRGYKVHGNAWQPSGSTLVASGYKRIRSEAPRTNNDIQSINQYHWKAADNLKKYYDYNKLDKGKTYVVNLYSTGSPYSKKALAEGNPDALASHTGQLRFENGQWMMYHNWHGTVKKTPIDNVWGSDSEVGITSIWLPNEK